MHSSHGSFFIHVFPRFPCIPLCSSLWCNHLAKNKNWDSLTLTESTKKLYVLSLSLSSIHAIVSPLDQISLDVTYSHFQPLLAWRDHIWPEKKRSDGSHSAIVRDRIQVKSLTNWFRVVEILWCCFDCTSFHCFSIAYSPSPHYSIP